MPPSRSGPAALGPVVFLTFINDSTEQLASQVRLFADDTAVYLTMDGARDIYRYIFISDGADSDQVLQNDLDTLSVWESRWDTV